MEARLGRTEDAISHLQQAIEDDDRIKAPSAATRTWTHFGTIRASRRSLDRREPMATATEKAYVVARLDEPEPAPLLAPDATDDGRQRFDVRRRFGITSFGTNAYRAPSEVDVIREHDETLLGEALQEELYIVLNGTATFEIDGDTVEAPAGSLVLVQPTAKRKATARTTARRSSPSADRRARRTSPRRRRRRKPSRPTTRATTRPPSPSNVVVEKRPDDAVVVLQRRLLRGTGRTGRRGDRASGTGRRAERPHQGASSAPTRIWTPSAKTRASTC